MEAAAEDGVEIVEFAVGFEVVALSAKGRVGKDVGNYIKVTGFLTGPADTAAGDTEFFAFGDTSGDGNFDPAGFHDDAFSFALGAGADPFADELDDSSTVALGTGIGGLVGQDAFSAFVDFVESEVDGVFDVLGRDGIASAEVGEGVVAAEVLEKGFEDRFVAFGARGVCLAALVVGVSASAGEVLPVFAVAVIEGAFIGVFEGFVSFADFFELLFCFGVVWVDVGVVLPRHLAVGGFDLFFVRGFGDAEQVVEVLTHMGVMLNYLSHL